ncbi:MAG: hypothetical protein KGH54_02815 [Candidatus Micrarchaeota archaeon]|nr:hypothetical protein [Candidatus Micrarchaeota archaeon]
MTQEFEKKNFLANLHRDDGDECPECSKGRITEDNNTGEKVCMKCGFVAQQGTESQELPIDSHSKPIMPGNTSIIELYGKDAAGKPISTTVKQSFHRLNIYKVVRDSAKDRREKSISIILDRISDKLNLSYHMKDEVMQLIRNSSASVRGRSLEVVVAASAYMACRENGIPKKLTEIAEIAGVQLKPLSKAYRIMLRAKLDWKGLDAQTERYAKIPTQDPVTCISQIASKLKIPESISRSAIKLIRENQKELTGSDPYSIGATALYLACRLYSPGYKSQKEIAAASGVTEVTIRNNLKKFKEARSKNLI